VLERFNFKWPAVLDCSRLPDGTAERSQLCIDPPTAVDQLDDALGPQGHAPANNLQLRQLLKALRSHNSSSWQHQQHDSVVSGNSPVATPTVMTSWLGDAVCSQRYVIMDESSSSSTCRPRCGVDVLYSDHDKRSVYTSYVCLSRCLLGACIKLYVKSKTSLLRPIVSLN